jgi:hypothetical protein
MPVKSAILRGSALTGAISFESLFFCENEAWWSAGGRGDFNPVAAKEGKPYTVRYEAVNAMLLNEFLKEHRKVQEQERTIAQLKQIEALTAGFQNVSAQLEALTPQVVANDQ